MFSDHDNIYIENLRHCTRVGASSRDLWKRAPNPHKMHNRTLSCKDLHITSAWATYSSYIYCLKPYLPHFQEQKKIK